MAGASGSALPLPLRPDPAAIGFTGRAGELERLRSAWAGGAPLAVRAVLVGGEPGIGKTRLVAELAASVVAGGGVVAYGACDEFVRPPYQPFVQALAGLVAECDPSELLRVEVFARLVPDARTRLPAEPPAGTTDADADRYVLFDAADRLLDLAARSRPVLVIVDDLHWASAPTLLLLRHLVRSPRAANVLLIGTFRDTEVVANPALAALLADLRRDESVARVSVRGFDEPDVARLVAAAAGHPLDPPGETLARALHGHSGGNPFFITEVLRHLVDSGALYQRAGRWVSDAGSIEALQLPDSVRALVLRRLDPLPEDARQVLTVAAVAGYDFEPAVVESTMAGRVEPAAVLDAMERAVEAGLVVERADGSVRFAHALVRQVIVEEISATRRAQIHGQVADALEQLEPRPFAALAHHYAASVRPDAARRAAECALEAGGAALAGLAFEDAVSHFEQGLRLLEGEPDHRALTGTARPSMHLGRELGWDGLRAALLIGLADVRDATGDVPGMKQAALDAAEHARRAGDTSLLGAAAVRAGRWVEIGTPDPEVRDLCAAALDALAGAPERDRLAVRLTLLNHRVYAEGAGPAAWADATATLAAARDVGDEQQLGIALSLRAASLLCTEHVAERLELADELVALGERNRDPRSLLDGHLLRGAARLELGDRQGFEEDARALSALGERLHWWIATRLANAFLIVLAIADGRLVDAEEMVESALIGSTNPNDFAGYATQLFTVRREQGRAAELVPAVEAVVTENPGLFAMRAALGVALVESGDRTRAQEMLAELVADDLAAAPRDQTWMATLIVLAELAVALHDVAAAGVLRPALAPHRGHLAVAIDGFVCFGAVDRYLGLLAAVLGDWEAAERDLEAACALEGGIGASAWLARTEGWAARVARRDVSAASDG